MSVPPRRLSLVITELEPGGAERMLVELSTRLDRQRFEPIVYSLAPPPARSSLVERLAAAHIPTHFLNLRSPRQYFSAVSALATHFQAQRTEIVQSYLFHANILAMRAAQRAGVPHRLTGIRVADPRGWRLWVERHATSRADRFVCVSQSVAEYVRRRGFASEKLQVIPNGVDLARYKDARPADLSRLGVPKDKQALLYIGRLDLQKGLDRFFAEVPRLLRDLPSHDLVLAGTGPLEASLRQATSAGGTADRVHFLGYRDDVPELLKASALLVLPSRWEGMPNVVLEAMATGKPVVATQSEGTVELLGLGALEQSVSIGDWPGLRSRIVEIAQSHSLAKRLARQNQERAAQFSLERVADRYQKLYWSLIDQKSAAS